MSFFKVVNCSMQSDQNPLQSAVNRIRAYGSAQYTCKCHIIIIIIVYVKYMYSSNIRLLCDIFFPCYFLQVLISVLALFDYYKKQFVTACGNDSSCASVFRLCFGKSHLQPIESSKWQRRDNIILIPKSNFKFYGDRPFQRATR